MIPIPYLKRHLSDQGIALYIECLQDDQRRKDLPEEVLTHVEQCSQCRKRAFLVFDVIRNDPAWQEEVRRKTLSKDIPYPINTLFGKKPSVFYIPIAAAASALLLVAASYLFLIPQSPGPENLFGKYFQPDPDLISTRSSPDSAHDLLGSALSYYNAGEDTRAIPLLREYHLKSPGDTLAGLYLGISYLMAERPEESIPEFKVHPGIRGRAFAEVYEWYLALSYLRAGNMAESKSLLLPLSKGHSVYAAKARLLLTELPGS